MMAVAAPPRRRALMGARLLPDLSGVALGVITALVLLWYLHGAWQPGWAVLCGAISGIAIRRALRPSYASFPGYLREPLDKGVVLLGAIVTTWATLAREPTSYWLLRWREAVTLPVLGGVLGVGLAGVIYSHSRLRREIEDARTREAASREAALHARLRALQAQINPHFLFNAFNALAELTHDDPETAERTVNDLAHLLRYTLRSSAAETVPLSQELDAIHRYLRIEEARLGDRLRVEKVIDEAALSRAIPGLVLQPLVENAVLHAVAERSQGGTIRIVVDAETDHLSIRVEDDGPGLPADIVARLNVPLGDATIDLASGAGTGGAGGGLNNVLQRLALKYRGAATLTVTSSNHGTRIEMRIPS